MDYKKIFGIQEEIDFTKKKIRFAKRQLVKARASLITSAIVRKSGHTEAVLARVKALEEELGCLETELEEKEADLILSLYHRAGS